MTGSGQRPWGASFSRLLIAGVVSPLGDAMATLALILYVQETANTGTAVGLLLLSGSAGPLLAPLMGVAADRVDRRVVLVTCAAGQAVVVGLMAALLPSWQVLLAFVFAGSLLATAQQPAFQALLPTIVEDQGLPRANALLAGGREFGSVLGPPFAGLLYPLIHTRGVLVIDAGSFVVSVWLFTRLPKPARQPGRSATSRGLKGVRVDAVDGLRYVFGHSVIRALTIGFWLIVFCTGADDLVLPFLGRDTLHTDAFGIGLLLAGASIGLVAMLSVLAAASRARRGPVRSHGSERGRLVGPTARIRAALLGFALASVGNLLTAVAPGVTVAVATQVLRGSGLALIDTNVQTVLQRESDPRKLGRVMANVWGGVGLAAALSYAAGGPLLDATSPRTMFIIIGTSGLACTLFTMVLLRRPRPRAAADADAAREI
jgi:MFS family permease